MTDRVKISEEEVEKEVEEKKSSLSFFTPLTKLLDKVFLVLESRSTQGTLMRPKEQKI